MQALLQRHREQRMRLITLLTGGYQGRRHAPNRGRNAGYPAPTGSPEAVAHPWFPQNVKPFT